MVGFDTSTSGCLKNHEGPWKVCYYISQPTCLVPMPVAHWEDTRLVQPFTWTWGEKQNSHSVSLSSKCGLAESARMRPLEQEWRQPAISQIYPRGQISHQLGDKTGIPTSLLLHLAASHYMNQGATFWMCTRRELRIAAGRKITKFY